MNATPRVLAAEPTLADVIGGTWTRFWFTPAGPWPLALVRVLGGLLALALWASYAWDLETWFGPAGMISPELLAAWRSPFAVSFFDFATSPTALWFGYLAGGLVLVATTIGLATPLTTVLGALAFTTLLHRGPMLVGPADDVVAMILWCLAIGRSGDALSVDRLIVGRRGRTPPTASWRTRIAIGLLQVHASVIVAAAVLAQLKGDVWWNGTAAWWLAARADSPLVDLTGIFLRSEYLTNLVTHAIVVFEILFAAGLWFPAARRVIVRIALVAWPLVGLIAGEPFWGLAMTVLTLGCLPTRVESSD
ncbi:MAG: hypothetical protein EBR28_10990 [Planctomycetia bacterium]|nr:hypothetical protein [Planctomycetia bacterium]